MKFNFYLITFLCNLFIVCSAYSDDLFGFQLYTNLQNKIATNDLYKNRYKYPETQEGFYIYEVIETKNIVINTTPYVDNYVTILNEENFIHGVIGIKSYSTIDVCKSVSKNVKKIIENKFQINLTKAEFGNPSYDQFSYQALSQSNNIVTINCNFYHQDGLVEMWIAIYSWELREKIDDFYESGF